MQVTSDGIAMVTQLEWSENNISGNNDTYICSFLTGILIYGPDEYIRVSGDKQV